MLLPAMVVLSRPAARGERGPDLQAAIAIGRVEPAIGDRLSSWCSRASRLLAPAAAVSSRQLRARCFAVELLGVEVAGGARGLLGAGPRRPRQAHAFLQNFHSPGRRAVA